MLESSKSSRVMLMLPIMAARAHAAFGRDQGLTAGIHMWGAVKGVPATGPCQGLPKELPKLHLTEQQVQRRCYGLTATGYDRLFPEAEVEQYRKWRTTPVRLDRWVTKLPARRRGASALTP